MSSKITFNELNRKLNAEFGEKICCQESGETTKIRFRLKTNNPVADIAICFNTKRDIACVWDLAWHKYCKGIAKNLTITEKWEEFLVDTDSIKTIYKLFDVDTNKKREIAKVIVLSFDTLNEIYKDLYDYIIPNSSDENYVESPSKYNLIKNIGSSRKKHTVQTWNRTAKFRRDVLSKYNNTCIVCRCNVKEILQAAHIKAVADDGDDNIENGICLCANHHLMFDNDLISISADKTKLIKVDDSVKSMTWYNEFKEKYNEELYVPK